MEDKKISVVLPVYNAEKYLEQTLDSIVAQTYLNWELICVNDGSTDVSKEILERYSANDGRVKVINVKNGGPGYARNKGLERAEGYYTFILDADDVYSPDMFTVMTSAAAENDCDIVICSSNELNDETGRITPIEYSLNFRLLKKTVNFNYTDNPDYFFMFCIGWSWDKLYKTQFIRESGLKFQEMRNTDDAYFVFASLVKARSITALGDVLVNHRVGVKTSTSCSREKTWDCFYKAVTALKNELIAMNLYAELERAFLNWALQFSCWNLETLAPPAKEKLFLKLKNEWFEELGIDKHPPEYYMYGADYGEYRNVADKDYSEYMRIPPNRKMFRKLFGSIKRYGIRYTLKKAFNKLRRKK